MNDYATANVTAASDEELEALRPWIRLILDEDVDVEWVASDGESGWTA